MKRFLRQHDLIYEQSPTRWLDGIPLGNGNMGLMLWVDRGILCGTLDKTDVWEARHHEIKDTRYNYRKLRRLIKKRNQAELLRIFEQGRPERHGGIYATKLPFPRLRLDFGTAIESCTARLRLHPAEAEGRIGLKDGGTFVWRCFLHAERNVFFWERRTAGGAMDVCIDNSHFNQQAVDFFKSGGYPEAVVAQAGGWQTYYQGIPGQGGYAIASKRERIGTWERLYVSVAYASAEGAALEQARETVTRVIAEGMARQRVVHRRWWQAFWDKSFLTIPDARMENLYYAEMYKLGCNHRPDKPPCSLQGVWTRGDGGMPPWCGEYAADQNVQECYWPIYTSNRLDLGLGLYAWVNRVLPAFQKRGRTFFGRDATLVGGVGLHGEPIYGWFTVDFWPGLGAWLAHMLWLHWLYSRDKRFLREQAYPVMKPFMHTYLNLLEKDADGKYHLPVSCSPEYWGNDIKAWDKDTTGDLYLMRWLAAALLETARVLKLADPDAPRWRDLLDNLAEPQQGATAAGIEEQGLWLSRRQRLDKSHRHHTHLLGIYPLGNLTIEGGAKDDKVIQDSIRHSIWRGSGSWEGYSFPHMALIAARALKGNMAWQMLQNYFHFIALNTLHVNGDPRCFGVSASCNTTMTLEGGFGYAAAVMEMLLQSWGKTIRIFPGVPESWRNLYFKDLRAEGAFLVTAKMTSGRVVFVEVTGEKGDVCRIRNPFDKTVTIENLQTGKRISTTKATIAFKTRPGDRLRLYPAGARPSKDDLAPIVFRRRKEESNWFGIKRHG